VSDLYDRDVVIRNEQQARTERQPPTDGELVAVTAIVTSAVANLHSVSTAREAARRQRAQRPGPMYLSPEQLAEAYRRAGLRNPRARADTTPARHWKKA
jgi:hypothetical protein